MLKHALISFMLFHVTTTFTVENQEQEESQQFKIQAFSLLIIELQDGTLIKRLPTGGACLIKNQSRICGSKIVKMNGYTFGGDQTDTEFIAETKRYGQIKNIYIQKDNDLFPLHV